MSSRSLFAGLAFALASLLAAQPRAHAQVQVGLKISRRLYMAYEPVIATVSISNLTGHDLTLADHGPQKWFGFQITNADETPVPPRHADYDLQPLTIPNGTTVRRSVNLVSLYPVTDFGLYRIRANIFVGEMNRYFSSSLVGIEVSEGKVLWQQTVGVPAGEEGAGSYRLYELLSFRQPKDNVLYARVQDKEAGVIYATYPVGRLIAGNEPQVQLDRQNRLHILQLVGPKAYVYSRIGLNGEWGGQTNYLELKSRPHLARLASGSIAVAGGKIDVPVEAPAQGTAQPPKLSDRPAGMPTK